MLIFRPKESFFTIEFERTIRKTKFQTLKTLHVCALIKFIKFHSADENQKINEKFITQTHGDCRKFMYEYAGLHDMNDESRCTETSKHFCSFISSSHGRMINIV